MTDTGQDGFTLVEVLVAFVILSAVAIASLKTISIGVRANIATERRIAAASFAQTKFAELRRRVHSSNIDYQGQTSDGQAWLLKLDEVPLPNDADWLETRVFGATLVVTDQASGARQEFRTTLLAPFGNAKR